MPRRRRSGKSADWVYRPNRWSLVDNQAQEARFSGTYGVPIALPVNTLTGQVLYDSDMLAGPGRSYGPINPADTSYLDVAAEARTGGSDKGALIHGVELVMSWRPSTWALGNLVWLGIRIVVADQDAQFGTAQLDPNYDLWTNIGGDATTEISRFANGRQNCYETRIFEQFNENSVRFDMRRYARFKRRLQAQEGLFLLLQTHPLSVNLTSLNMYCRTLVTDSE